MTKLSDLQPGDRFVFPQRKTKVKIFVALSEGLYLWKDEIQGNTKGTEINSPVNKL